MSLLIEVGDRGAWPVRALPWISGHDGPRWHLDAVDVASALGAATVEWVRFAAVRAWRADGSVIEPNDWLATADRLRRLRPDFPDHDEWRLRATLTLPADAFVWFDEWSGAYRACPFGPDHLRLLLDEPELDPDERRELEHEARARDLISQPQMDPGLATAVMEGRRLLTARELALVSGVRLDIGLPGLPESPPMRAARFAGTVAPVSDRGRRVKRAVLVAENGRRWPTVERDLKECTKNGLRDAAGDDTFGFWWEGSALGWARARGKVRDISPGLADLPKTSHRMKG